MRVAGGLCDGWIRMQGVWQFHGPKLESSRVESSRVESCRVQGISEGPRKGSRLADSEHALAQDRVHGLSIAASSAERRPVVQRIQWKMAERPWGQQEGERLTSI